jgi:hypothetical protein
LGKQSALLRRQLFSDFLDNLPHLFEHLQLQVIDLTDVPIISRFVEGVGAQYAERFLSRHAYLIPQRITSRAQLFKFFPKARLRGFGQILERLLQSLLPAKADITRQTTEKYPNKQNVQDQGGKKHQPYRLAHKGTSSAYKKL